MTADLAHAQNVPTEESVREWLQSELGEVVRMDRQARWRPCWYVDVVRDGKTLPLYVRGPRVDTDPQFTLNHEMTLHRLLEENGIPVPHVHGSCDEPNFYVMDRVDGVFEFTDSTDAQRHAVVDQYLQALARMHSLDVQQFSDAGITRATAPELSWQPGMAAFERSYRSSKQRPDPLMEWGLAWCHRNPPDTGGREAPVVWDSGQFLHRDGQMLAMIDFEVGHIGDPMIDLAGWRMRGTIMNYGDFEDLYARYGEYRGEPVDLEAIRWHHFAFTLTNQLTFHAALAAPPLGSGYMTNLQWCTETNVMVVEAYADNFGIDLEQVEVPSPEVGPNAPAFGHLVESLRHFPATDGISSTVGMSGASNVSTYEARMAFRLARHLQRFNEIGRKVVEADLDDLEPLLGHRPATWQEGEEALEKFVIDDNGVHDNELLHLFNRRTRRAHMLLGPEGSAMAQHHPCQPFPPR
ncbi:phosphotransferase family protein [Parafrankia sp. FMc2]|uniref:phosphotransferase family protein n=1 Tax=Parafrankia sp. FMc2 TaxID=3233196 RepID=UPI0034D5FF56